MKSIFQAPQMGGLENIGQGVGVGARIAGMIPKDAPVQPGDIVGASESRQTRAVKIVNLHQQCVESSMLMTMVNENPDKTMKYFRSKPNILETDLKNLVRGGRS